MCRIVNFIIVSLCAIMLSACENDDKAMLKVGSISGPETDLMQTVKKVAKDKYDLTIKIVIFNDYALPNTALADGSIDVNVFQHLPYLQTTNKARGYDLASVGKTFIFPMGVYSKKYTSLDQLPDKAVIAIPNDPTNEARALLLLQKAGLITLKFNNFFVTVHDIKDNPKHLQFKSLDAAQLPRVLPDVAAAAINTNYAVPAGLSPNKDTIFKEDKDSDYANIIAVRAVDKSKKEIQYFIQAYQSDAVAEKAKEIFGEGAIQAW